MSADWIKMRTDLYRDPKVCVMADMIASLNDVTGDVTRYGCRVTRCVTRNAAVGALVSVWGVARQRGRRNGDDLVLSGCTLSVLDDIADLPGFGDAMAAVGWAEQREEGVVLPCFFNEFNEDPKSASATRQKRYRDRKKAERDVTRDVTGDVTGDVTRYVSGDVTGDGLLRPREEKRREEKEEDSSEPASPASEPTAAPASPETVLTFPTVGKGPKSWGLTASQVSEWATLFPSLDILAECRKALAWVQANPTKKKTAQGMGKFLVGWFTRATDAPATPRGSPFAPPPVTRPQVLYDLPPVAPTGPLTVDFIPPKSKTPEPTRATETEPADW